jgi:hypothetical protein
MAGRDDWNPDTAGRSLAEILREAGIERADRASRRRSWDDPDETAIRQRRAEAAADRSNRAGYGRRKGDLADRVDADRVDADRVDAHRVDADRAQGGPAAERPPVQPAAQAAQAAVPPGVAPAVEGRRVRRPVPEPSTAAIPGLRPDRKPGVPHPSGPLPSGPIPPLRERAPTERPATGRVVAEREPVPDRGSSRRVPGARDRTSSRSSGARVHEPDPHPSTGPIPVIRPEDVAADLDGGPRESALAWLRFAGELLIAVAAGVGVYFAATLLWEQLPHVAVFLAPLAVAALVGAVAMWRQRQGAPPMGPRLLALLVFAGTLLTIAPAASLLAAAA